MAPTPAQQMALLLEWLNDGLTDGHARRALHRFVASFSETRLRISRDDSHWLVHDAPSTELVSTRRKVLNLLAASYWFSDPGSDADRRGTEHIGADDVRLPLSFPSLRFGAFRQTRRAEKRSMLSRTQRRVAGEQSTYQVRVEAGRLRDLVPYLVLQLLAMPSDIDIRKCGAPERGNWDGTCGRLFVVASGLRGRPREYCGDECTDRANKKAQEEQLRRRKR